MANFVDKILGLRPKKHDAASTRQALGQARESLTQAEEHVADLERQRGSLMLRGTAAEMTAGEADLAAARLDADRLHSLILSIEAELPAMVEAEFLAELKAKVAAANKLRADFIRRWNAEYLPAAQKIADLLLLENEANRARHAATMLAEAAPREGKASVEAIAAVMADTPGNPVAMAVNEAHPIAPTQSFGALVRLPGARDTETATVYDARIWPPPQGIKSVWEP